MAGPTATVCLIVKDEGPYLLEWLAYHRVLGFDRCLVYDNDSTDTGAGILRALAAAGHVDLVPWPSVPGRSPQLSAYADAVRRAATDYVAFLDADEFLNLHHDDSVGQWLSRFPAETGAIGVNWRIFGSAGAERYDDRLVIERFTRAGPRRLGNNHHLKYLARPSLVKRLDIHYCTLKRGLYLDADGEPLQMSRPSWSDDVTFATAQVNHYALKSRQEFEWKKARGNANRPPEAFDKYTSRSHPEYWTILDRNDEEDRTILRRLDRTKAEMERLSDCLDGRGRSRRQAVGRQLRSRGVRWLRG